MILTNCPVPGTGTIDESMICCDSGASFAAPSGSFRAAGVDLKWGRGGLGRLAEPSAPCFAMLGDAP